VSDDRRERGRRGEEAAAATYRRMGFEEVARNWRCRLGELDLVVSRGGLLVFCEVKTRSGAAFGGGYEAVTATKQRKLRRLAEAFLGSNRIRPESIRFDVASVGLARVHDPDVHLFVDAF
jgi:putative endonuclease